MKLYGYAVVAFAVAFVVIGAALVVVTASAGGGVLGYVLGALFLALGAARLTLYARARR